MGIDVVDAAQFTGGGHLFEFQEDRMVLEEVPYHEDPIFLFGQSDQILSIFLFEDQGFFDVDVFAGEQGFPGEGVVGLGRGGDDDALNVFPGEGVI